MRLMMQGSSKGFAICWVALLLTTVSAQRIDVSIAIDGSSVRVPSGFMGLSIEPMIQADIYCKDPVFVQLIRNLVAMQTGPFNIRWGGNTQDNHTQEAPMSVWEAMRDLHLAADRLVTYTIGLNLPARDTAYALAQVKNAARVLPPEAVASLAVGNEADSYMYRRRPQYTMEYMLAASDGWFDEQLVYMQALAPTVASWLGPGQGARVFQGPAAANAKDWPTSLVGRWAALGKDVAGGPFARTVSLHKYAGNSNKANVATIEYLLSDTPARDIRRIAGQYAVASHKANLTFRMDEINTMSSAGKLGVSDTLGAVLYLIDVSLSTMQVQSDGLNIHMSGCAPYSPIKLPSWCGVTGGQTDDKYRQSCPDTCGDADAAALVGAPYYALWFMQTALANASSAAGVGLLGQAAVVPSVQTSIRMYALRAGGEARVVLLNTAVTGLPITVSITLNGKTSYGPASLLRLTGSKSGLSSKLEDLSFGGQTIDQGTGKIRGSRQAFGILPTQGPSSSQVYSVTMPPSSAALLLVPTVPTARAASIQARVHLTRTRTRRAGRVSVKQRRLAAT